MYQGTKGVEGQVFKEELLTIVAAILTRMDQERPKKHLIITVRPL